jgi:branched-chain amino acid transport system permease protein
MNRSQNARLSRRVPTLGLVVVVACLLPLLFTSPYAVQVLIMAAINVILASSVRLINLTGQLSLGTGAMMTVGGYFSALLCIHFGLSPWVGLVLGGVVACAVACSFGFAFVRLRGMYFAMVTLFFAQIMILIVEQWRGLTGGTSGLFNIPRPEAAHSDARLYYVIVASAVVSLGLMYLIERSRLGLVFRGIKQSHTLCESVGIDVSTMKVVAFGLGSFFAGVAGAFYGQYMQALNPGAFGFLFCVYTVIYMVVGGAGSFVGPVLGAVVLTLLNDLLRPLAQFQPLFFAAVLLLVVFFMPEGLVGLPVRLKKVAERLAGGRGRGAA